MLAQPISLSITKSFKIQLFDFDTFEEADYVHKAIKPIPLLRINTSSSHKVRANLAKRGNKYYSKLVASGPDVVQTLNNIKKIKSIKVANFFEFDAYMCNYSGLKELHKIHNTVKRTAKDMTLRIRRAKPEDKEALAKFCKSTFCRLDGLFLDLPGTPDLDDIDMANFAKAFKGSGIKRFKNNFVNLPGVSEEGSEFIADGFLTLQKLEELNMLMYLKKVRSLDTDIAAEGELCSGCLARLPNLKKLSISMSTYTGWTAMTVEMDPLLQYMFASLAESTKLESIELRYGNEQLNGEIIMALSNSIMQLKALKNLSIEFQNTKISDFEIALFGQEFAKFTHLERLTFKVIQHPCASEACVVQFVKNILELKNTKMFDVYFRRMDISEEGIENIREQFSKREELDCQVSSKSFHAFRRPYHLANMKNSKKSAIESEKACNTSPTSKYRFDELKSLCM